MMKQRVTNVGIFLVSICIIGVSLGHAGEFDDGISSYKDEPIAADDTALESDTNLNFVIVDAISSARAGRDTSNFNDGQGDNNQNSVVIEAGVGDINGNITNIVIEQP